MDSEVTLKRVIGNFVGEYKSSVFGYVAVRYFELVEYIADFRVFHVTYSYNTMPSVLS